MVSDRSRLFGVYRDSSRVTCAGALPYHEELNRGAATHSFQFFVQQEASVGPLKLVEYGRICGAGEASRRHCTE